jgi:hypothetical protein
VALRVFRIARLDFGHHPFLNYNFPELLPEFRNFQEQAQRASEWMRQRTSPAKIKPSTSALLASE